MLSAICFNLNQSKILSSGNGLKALCIKALENIVGLKKKKKENPGNQYFLLFPQCFLLCEMQTSCFERQ